MPSALQPSSALLVSSTPRRSAARLWTWSHSSSRSLRVPRPSLVCAETVSRLSGCSRCCRLPTLRLRTCSTRTSSGRPCWQRAPGCTQSHRNWDRTTWSLSASWLRCWLVITLPAWQRSLETWRAFTTCLLLASCTASTPSTLRPPRLPADCTPWTLRAVTLCLGCSGRACVKSPLQSRRPAKPVEVLPRVLRQRPQLTVRLAPTVACMCELSLPRSPSRPHRRPRCCRSCCCTCTTPSLRPAMSSPWLSPLSATASSLVPRATSTLLSWARPRRSWSRFLRTCPRPRATTKPPPCAPLALSLRARAGCWARTTRSCL
mmetsp:Transcript_36317/g.82800  ORF Transcript_36317/g.82800 Transcript_36317/m.82800 type:complete len:318 (-) Transcript_36317:5779-6732(-)